MAFNSKEFPIAWSPDLSAFDRHLKASSRIDYHNGLLEGRYHKAIFNHYEKEEILKVLLCDSWPRDVYVWAYSKKVHSWCTQHIILLLEATRTILDRQPLHTLLNAISGTNSIIFECLWRLRFLFGGFLIILYQLVRT